MADDSPQSTARKPTPTPTPDSEPYWTAAANDQLKIQRCAECERWFFYPRTSCPSCASKNVEWKAVSGRARLHTYLINHRPAPGFESEAPYAIAVVELEEGPRMMSNIVGVDNTPERLILDMPLEVVFDHSRDVTVPLFRPRDTQS